MRELFERGDWIGEYEVLGRLKAGGMATLFLGRRHGAAGVSRPVVIKVIHPHLAEDEQIVKMFIDEARISSQISHGNVVYIEKFGEHAGAYYMALEYVDGCSLEQLLRTMFRRQETLAPEIAAHLVIEAAAGLHAAHETVGDDGGLLGIVHRDVSPSNILLTRDGGLKVIDFGIAKARNRLGETRGGSGLKGKLRYMSPEQAWGRETDRRTDVYALGVVLWELLTSRQLFRGSDDLALLDVVRNPKVPPPSTVNPNIGAALDAVVLRATAADVEHRLQTALELRRELLRAMPGATAVGADVVGELVAKVRQTLGPLAPGPGDDAPTTPIDTPPAFSAPPPAERTMRNAAGEIHASRRRTRGWVAIVGVGAVCCAAALVIVRMTGDDGAPAATSPPAPPSEPVPTPSPALAAAVDAAVVDAAAVVESAPAAPVNKPITVRPGKAIAKPSVKAIEVDGVTLAAEPRDAKPKPKTKPKPKRDEVRVDGTVLSE